MSRLAPALASMVLVLAAPLRSQEPRAHALGHYLFAWTGDSAGHGKDFLAVIDADPASPSYGQLVATVATDQQTRLIHHTEYTMPASGLLFANDHDAGRTFILDVRDPLHPKVEISFTDRAGYTHPHSYVRLPNGHVLASFQHARSATTRDSAMGTMSMDVVGGTGGLVEIDDSGNVIRSASSADARFPGVLLTPYSLVVLPDIDRVVSTNSSMSHDDLFRGLTYQVWRLSDLKLLTTEYFDTGRLHYGQIDPEEPRRGPDGSVFVQTVACGLERVTALGTSHPKSRLVYTFPGSSCGVPTIVGHYLIESVPSIKGLVVLDIANGAKPREVSRVRITDSFSPHWTAWDSKTHRIAVTGSADRLYLLNFDLVTGAISVDDGFHDAQGRPGFDFRDREWPQGWKGSGTPHGVVFSR
jgi:hypothetical protein